MSDKRKKFANKKNSISVKDLSKSRKFDKNDRLFTGILTKSQ